MERAGFYDHHENAWQIIGTADASGLAQGYLGPVAEGYCWYVERLTAWSNTAQAAPELEVFVLSTNKLQSDMSATVGSRAGRQDVTLAAADDVSDQNSPIYVGPGQYLVAFWSGFTSGDQMVLSTQVAVQLLSLDIEPRALVMQQAEPIPDITGDPDAEPEPENLLERAIDTVEGFFSGSPKAL